MDLTLRLALRKYALDPSDENAHLAATAALRAEGSMMVAPIEGVLTVSRKHLSPSELDILNWRVLPNFPHHVEEPRTSGQEPSWWLYCPDLTKLTPRGFRSMIYTDPQYINTKNLVELALSYSCDWLRLTPDGPTINTLPILS